MNIDRLLKRLRKINVFVAEQRSWPDGKRLYVLVSKLPQMPFGDENAYYTLVLEPGEDSVDREEIDTMLRRFWHGSVNFFDDDIMDDKETIN